MNTPPQISKSQFETLLAEHQRLIELVNDLEFQLYQLGEAPENTPVADCQKTAGALIGKLRNLLFRWDQEILPLLDASASNNAELQDEPQNNHLP